MPADAEQYDRLVEMAVLEHCHLPKHREMIKSHRLAKSLQQSRPGDGMLISWTDDRPEPADDAAAAACVLAYIHRAMSAEGRLERCTICVDA